MAKMLNPCSPCCCPGAPCEQCMFGYQSDKCNHAQMKNLILSVLAGNKPAGWKNAEYYMTTHRDWKEEICHDGDITLSDIETMHANSIESKCNGKTSVKPETKQTSDSYYELRLVGEPFPITYGQKVNNIDYTNQRYLTCYHADENGVVNIVALIPHERVIEAYWVTPKQDETEEGEKNG